MIIYIDLLFLINFTVDIIILSVVCLSYKVHILRRISAALTGSLYACLFVTDMPKIIFSFPVRLIVLIIMCTICFAPCRIKQLVSKSFLALTVSFFFCGIIYTLQGLFNIPHQENISDFLLAGGICAGYFSARLLISILKRSTSAEENCITVFYNNRQATLHGIYDSGNSLLDPISKTPVIIADVQALSHLFPGIKCPEDLCELVDPKDFKTVPYKTISDSGIVFGFLPTKIILNKHTAVNAIIAAAPNKLESDILINPLLLT